LQFRLHDLLTQAADAKDKAGIRLSMFWKRSSFIDAKPVIGVLASFGFSSIVVEIIILQLLLDLRAVYGRDQQKNQLDMGPNILGIFHFRKENFMERTWN